MALAVNDMFHPSQFDEDPRIAGQKFLKEYAKEAEGNIDLTIFNDELDVLLGL